MSKENSRERKLELVFASDKKLDKLYVTSNDKIFTSEGMAKSHAFKLKDDTVDIYRRGESYSPKSVKPVQPVEDSKSDAKKEREELFAKHKELFGSEPAKTSPTKALKEKIEAEEARLAEKAKEDPATGEGAGGDGSKGAEG